MFVESASQGLSTRSQHFHFYYTSSGLEWKILLIHFVISSWSTKKGTSGVCWGGRGRGCERTRRTPLPYGPVSFVSLSMKKTVERRQNNSGVRKTERDVSLSCAFFGATLSSNWSFYLNLSLSWFIFNVHLEQTLKITCISWITSYPYFDFVVISRCVQ